MTFKTLDDADVKGKRVLVRVDLNVPMEAGVVTDDTRIRAVLPTITEISNKGGKVVLLAHFGRPKDGPEAKYSLEQIVAPLASRLGLPVGSHRPNGLGRSGVAATLSVARHTVNR